MGDYEERSLGGITVRIDRTQCIATQNCIKVAPEVLELGDDIIVTFLEDAQEIEQERMIEACAICPVDALFAFDEHGRQIVPR